MKALVSILFIWCMSLTGALYLLSSQYNILETYVDTFTVRVRVFAGTTELNLKKVLTEEQVISRNYNALRTYVISSVEYRWGDYL